MINFRFGLPNEHNASEYVDSNSIFKAEGFFLWVFLFPLPLTTCYSHNTMPENVIINEIKKNSCSGFLKKNARNDKSEYSQVFAHRPASARARREEGR